MNSPTQTRPSTGKVARDTIRLGIVCPMANEGDDAIKFTRQALDACNGFASVTFFAVFDKANKDNSLDLMREYSRTDPRLVVVWAPENRCVVDAYLRGYKEALAAGSDWILEIDAGFSHRPEDIPRFFDAMENGLDCVFGSRFMPGAKIESSWKRRTVSRGGTLLTNMLLGTNQTDMTSGFELFSAKTLRMVLDRGIRSRAHFFQTEIKVHCRNLKFVEVPIVYEMASPRLGSRAIKEAFRELWRLFRSRSAA